MTDRVRNSCQCSLSENKPRSRNQAFDKALLTGRAPDSAHQDLLLWYTTDQAVGALIPSPMRRRTIVRRRFQCLSLMARRRLLTWASSLCSSHSSASVTIWKNSIQPRRDWLTWRIQVAKDL